MKKTLWIWVVLFLLAGTANARVLLYDDCEKAWLEGTDWNSAIPSGNSITVSTEQKRAGSKSYKFSLQILPAGATDTSKTNVELVLRGLNSPVQLKNFIIGQEYWMGYSIYIPKKYSFRNFWTSPQFHLAYDPCESTSLNLNPNVGFFFDSNLVQTISIGGDATSCTTSKSYPRRYLYTPAYPTGQWNDIVLHWRFAYDGSGFFEMWMNGVKVGRDTGINCNNDPKGPYLKVGIYAHANEVMTVYYDEIRFGDQNSSYAEVSPGGAPANQAPTVQITSPVGSQSIEEGDSLTFACTASDSDGAIASYLWTFDSSGNASSTAEDPGSRTFNTAGNYLIRVTVTDNAGATASATVNVSVAEVGEPPPIVTGLLHNWLMESGAITTDSEGNEDLLNNGSIAVEGAGTEPDPPGYGTHGVVLNGTSQFFSIADFDSNEPWQTGQPLGTIIMAFKKTSDPTGSEYLAGRWNTETNERTWGLVVDQGGTLGIYNGYASGAGLEKILGSDQIALNARYIVGMAFNATTGAYLLEAYNCETSTWLTTVSGITANAMNLAGGADFFLGKREGGPTLLYWPGVIYFARPYNTFLTQSELRQEMLKTTQAPASTVTVNTTGGTPTITASNVSGGTLIFTYQDGGEGSGSGVLRWLATVTAGMNTPSGEPLKLGNIVANGATINGNGTVVKAYGYNPGKTYAELENITLFTEFSGSDPVSLTLPSEGTPGSFSIENPVYIDTSSGDSIAAMWVCQEANGVDCTPLAADALKTRGQRICMATTFPNGARIDNNPYDGYWPFSLDGGGVLNLVYAGQTPDRFIWCGTIDVDDFEPDNLALTNLTDYTGTGTVVDNGGNPINMTAPQLIADPTFKVRIDGRPGVFIP